MKTAFSRATRPTARYGRSAVSEPGASASARGTVSGAAQRQLTLGDAFLVLLPSVLFGSAVIDTTWKQRHRKAWDEKIAAVEAETEAICARERQLRASTRRRYIQRQQILGVRHYSILTHHVQMNVELEELEPPVWNDKLQDEQVLEKDASEETTELEDNLMSRQKGDEVNRLVAVDLALRMILHIHTGSRPAFLNQDNRQPYQLTEIPSDIPTDLDKLIRFLRVTRQRLQTFKSGRIPERPSPSLEWWTREENKLDSEITAAANSFQRGTTTISCMINDIAESILRSQHPISGWSYLVLLDALQYHHKTDLSYMVVEALENQTIRLSTHAVFRVIWHCGKNRDANRLELFMKKLAARQDHQFISDKWAWKIVDPVQILVPVTMNPNILQMLLWASLKLNQPHRAEGYAHLLSESRPNGPWTSHVIRNFLKYYCHTRSWRVGRKWLATAHQWAEPLAEQGLRHLQRMIFSMLEFCVVCDRQWLYSQILRAAVDARIDVYETEEHLHNKIAWKILSEWKIRFEGRTPVMQIPEKSDVQKAIDFKQGLSSALLPNHETGRVFDPISVWPTPEQAQLKQLAREQKQEIQELESLKPELEHVKGQITGKNWIISGQDKKLKDQAAVIQALRAQLALLQSMQAPKSEPERGTEIDPEESLEETPLESDIDNRDPTRRRQPKAWSPLDAFDHDYGVKWRYHEIKESRFGSGMPEWRPVAEESPRLSLAAS